MEEENKFNKKRNSLAKVLEILWLFIFLVLYLSYPLLLRALVSRDNWLDNELDVFEELEREKRKK